MSAPAIEAGFELRVTPVTDMDGGLWDSAAPQSTTKSNSQSCNGEPPATRVASCDKCQTCARCDGGPCTRSTTVVPVLTNSDSDVPPPIPATGCTAPPPIPATGCTAPPPVR